jgi:leucyl-tRNA synthetase
LESAAAKELRKAFKQAPQTFKAFFIGDGEAVNSPLFDGQPTPQAKKTVTKWLEDRGLGQGAVNYRLRDWLFSRQRYWGEPFPVIWTEDGRSKLVAESNLPVTLPEMQDYQPTGTLEPPLTKALAWVKTVDPETGGPARREVNTMPQWAGSCWYYLRFLDPRNDRQAWRPEVEKYWMPVDLYVGGAEHAVLHLLYARFWHKVLYDCGLVSTKEPFQRLFNQGLIQAFVYQDATGRLTPNDEVEERPDGAFARKSDGAPLRQLVGKMSKSLKNVVPADAVIQEYGADTLRLYEMFMGPLEASKPWNPRDVPGVHRFLQRAWRLIIEDDASRTEAGSARSNLRAGAPTRLDADLERSLHKAIRKVTGDLEKLAFNTAISALMVFVNGALKDAVKLHRSQAERFVLLLAPFAPHMAEELWQRLGHPFSLARESWPDYDAALTMDAMVELAVQVNGKLRGRITVAAETGEEDLLQAARKAVAGDLEGKSLLKSIVVKGRLVNLVVKQE